MTFSLDLETSDGDGRDGRFGLAEEEAGDREGLEVGCREDFVEEEGVAGRGETVGGLVGPEDFRERKGEMEDL